MIETSPYRLGDVRAAHPSATGLSLTTTTQTLGLPKGSDLLDLTGHTYSTAVVARVLLGPYLTVLKTADGLVSVTDYSEAAQDNDASTDVVLSSLDTLANGDALWVGSHVPFRGLSVDVDAANGTVATLAAHYWNGSALADISPTDNTASGGATFAQDGTIVWTVPAAWARASIQTASGLTGADIMRQSLYWVRLTVSAAMDSSTTLNSLHALNRSTAYLELTSGRSWTQAILRGPGGVGSIEALTDAGTAKLVVNVATVGDGVFL